MIGVITTTYKVWRVGVKDLSMFGKSLVSKSLWKILTKDNLWCRIIQQKYMAPLSFVDCIRIQINSSYQDFNNWKAFTSAFSVLGNHLAWKVCACTQVSISANTIFGCIQNIYLPPEVIHNCWRLILGVRNMNVQGILRFTQESMRHLRSQNQGPFHVM